MIWNCTDFEECGAEPHVGFGTFLITRGKNGTSTTESSSRCPEMAKSSKAKNETKNRTTKNNETESSQKMEHNDKNSTTFAHKEGCTASEYFRDGISEDLDIDAVADWKPMENFTDCAEICCEDGCMVSKIAVAKVMPKPTAS